MSKPKSIETTGKVTDEGELKMWNRERFSEDIKLFKGSEVEIIIKRKVKTRSPNQLRYYFGVIVPSVQEGFRDIGYIWTKDKTDKFIRETFFFNEIVNTTTGTIIKEPLSLKSSDGDITTIRFMEIVDEIILFGATELNISISLPNEQGNLLFDETYYEKQNN